MMNVTILKYLAAGALITGVAVFEWFGKAPPGSFVGLATGALGILGYHAGNVTGKNQQP